MNWKTQHSKDDNFPQTYQSVEYNTYQNPREDFCTHGQACSKFYMERHLL